MKVEERFFFLLKPSLTSKYHEQVNLYRQPLFHPIYCNLRTAHDEESRRRKRRGKYTLLVLHCMYIRAARGGGVGDGGLAKYTEERAKDDENKIKYKKWKGGPSPNADKSWTRMIDLSSTGEPRQQGRFDPKSEPIFFFGGKLIVHTYIHIYCNIVLHIICPQNLQVKPPLTPPLPPPSTRKSGKKNPQINDKIKSINIAINSCTYL